MKYYTVIQGLSPDTLPAFYTAGADEMRLLTLLLASPDTPLSAEELSARLQLPPEDISCLIAFWRGAGALLLAETAEEAPTAPPKKKPLRSADKLPSYSSSERAKIIEEERHKQLKLIDAI